MYQQDYLMREIAFFINSIIKILFKRSTDMSFTKIIALNEQKNELSQLYYEILSLIDNKNYCEAENILFKHAENRSNDILELGLEFYNHINSIDEKTLLENNFSHEEIKQGVKDWLDLYDIKIPFSQTFY